MNLSYNITLYELHLGVILFRISLLGSDWKRSAELLINILALEASFYLAWLNLHAPICFRNMIYSSERLIDIKKYSIIFARSSVYYLLLTAKFISSNVNIKWKYCLICWNGNEFLELQKVTVLMFIVEIQMQILWWRLSPQKVLINAYEKSLTFYLGSKEFRILLKTVLEAISIYTTSLLSIINDPLWLVGSSICHFLSFFVSL